MFIVFGSNQLLFTDKIWFEQNQVNFGNGGTMDGLDVLKIRVASRLDCYGDLVHMSRHIFISAQIL